MIVILTKLNENGRPISYQYWPEDKKARFTYFIVEPTTQFKCDGYIIRFVLVIIKLNKINNFIIFREFLMTDARDGSSRTIRQFHFLTWPEDTEVPRQADHFIDLIGQVIRSPDSPGILGGSEI